MDGFDTPQHVLGCAQIWYRCHCFNRQAQCIPFTVCAQTNTGSLGTKYKIGDCITPIDPLYSWYGKTGQIVDVVYSQKYGQVVYVMLIDGKPRVGGSIPPPVTTFQRNINDLVFAN